MITDIFTGEIYTTVMCGIGRWSLRSWFDVNGPTFDEDMCEKPFFTF